ncbi:MAG: desulfoferrodoxin [bacterium]
MTTKNQIYKCEVCGNIVTVLHAGVGELVCCGQPMTLMNARTNDEGQEKHVPIVEKLQDNTIRVKVGSVDHPMENAHYIEWIEVITIDGKSFRTFLSPKDKPVAWFYVTEHIILVRAYCNIHGLWKFDNSI